MYNFFFHIYCFLKRIWNYLINGVYIPKTEYNIQMFNFYARVAADGSVQPETPAEQWTEMKLHDSFFKLFEDATEEMWLKARVQLYKELTLQMMQMLWLKPKDI